MTTEDYANGYQAGYQDAYQLALSSIPSMGKQLLEYITQVPKLKSGYSVYDGGYEDGISQAKKLIHAFFNTPVGK